MGNGSRRALRVRSLRIVASASGIALALAGLTSAPASAASARFATAGGSTSLAFDGNVRHQTVILTAVTSLTVTSAGTLVGPGGAGAPTTQAFEKTADTCAPASVPDPTPAPDPDPGGAAATASARELAPGESCSIEVSYTPAAGPVGGGLNINTSAGTKGVLLRGDAPKSSVCTPGCGTEGMLPAFAALVGTSSPAQAFRIRNGTADNARAPLGNIMVTAYPGFVVDATACAAPVPIGSECIVYVTFRPTSAGTFSGSLRIASDDPIPGPVVVVSGVATAPADASVAPPAVAGSASDPAGSPARPVTRVTVRAPTDAGVAVPRASVTGFGFAPRTIASGSSGRFAYTLSGKARVSIVIARRLPGKKARYRRRGALSVAGRSGRNTTTLKARLGATPLAAGTYRATIVATNSAGASRTRTTTFKVRARKRA